MLVLDLRTARALPAADDTDQITGAGHPCATDDHDRQRDRSGPDGATGPVVVVVVVSVPGES